MSPGVHKVFSQVCRVFSFYLLLASPLLLTHTHTHTQCLHNMVGLIPGTCDGEMACVTVALSIFSVHVVLAAQAFSAVAWGPQAPGLCPLPWLKPPVLPTLRASLLPLHFVPAVFCLVTLPRSADLYVVHFFLNVSFYLFIYLWLCRVFVAAQVFLLLQSLGATL